MEGTVVRLVSKVASVVFTASLLAAPGTDVASASGAPPQSTRGPCAFTETADQPAARPVPLPPDPRRTPDRGTARVTLHTSQGEIPLTLDRAEAPCTVLNFLHLSVFRFYDRTPCHRLTAYPTLKVLQCGDPTGTGDGGPGYEFKDELPTTLLPAPTDPTGRRKVYPRGMLAMANAGPNTNGSQFFLVQSDSYLLPDYTVFGSVGDRGLKTLDKIAEGGIQPAATQPPGTAPVDGKPVLPTNILRARLGGR
jgi:peptidyl-prolyl cis-trans isomerase B (cyclophilin B)